MLDLTVILEYVSMVLTLKKLLCLFRLGSLRLIEKRTIKDARARGANTMQSNPLCSIIASAQTVKSACLERFDR